MFILVLEIFIAIQFSPYFFSFFIPIVLGVYILVLKHHFSYVERGGRKLSKKKEERETFMLVTFQQLKKMILLLVASS
jgi:hypothetical protein